MSLLKPKTGQKVQRSDAIKKKIRTLLKSIELYKSFLHFHLTMDEARYFPYSWCSLWSFMVHLFGCRIIRLKENPILIFWLLSSLLWVLIFQKWKGLNLLNCRISFWSCQLLFTGSCPTLISFLKKVYHWELQAEFKIQTSKFHIYRMTLLLFISLSTKA